MKLRKILKNILEPLGLLRPAKKIGALLGIYNFNYHEQRVYISSAVRERIVSANLKNFSNVAIYGFDNETEKTINILKELKQFQHIKFIICDNVKVEEYPRYFYGLRICSIEDIKEMECIIIGNPLYQAAINAKLKYLVDDTIKIVNPFKQETVYGRDVLIENKYANSKAVDSEDRWNNQRAGMIHTQNAIDAYVDVVQNHVPLFQRIEIETINRCNGECSFCPVNKHIDPRPYKKMDEALFKKIVQELHELNYDGHVAIYSNNEPLIDPRNIEFNEYLREQVPNAKIYMHTNGTLLTKDKFVRLIAVLDELIIDNYSDELELLPAAKMVQEYCKEHPEAIRKVTIAMRKQNEILTTRGGAAPNRTKKVSYGNRKCSLPFRQMIIRPDGKLSLCCNDALGSKTLGDLTKQTLVEAWYGKEYQNMREKICKGRKEIDICRYCDEFHVIDM